MDKCYPSLSHKEKEKEKRKMTDSNYREVIDDVQDILIELLDDPEHGRLTFKGLHG